MSRIGIRILIGQYLELKKEEQEPGYVGLIYQHTNPAEITQQAQRTNLTLTALILTLP